MFNDFLIQLQPTLVTIVGAVITTLCGFVITYINKKKEELSLNIKSDISKKYADMLANTITKCVIATNQTFVDSLKAKGEFTKEAQERAFNKTFDNVKLILGEEALKYFESITSDVDRYLKIAIEAEVKDLKGGLI